MRLVCSVRAPPRTPPVRARTHARGRVVCVARKARTQVVEGKTEATRRTTLARVASSRGP